MTHRVTLASNPRILLALVLLALAVAAYLDYAMIRYLVRNLRSRVVTSGATISCRPPAGVFREILLEQGQTIAERLRPLLADPSAASPEA